jgi:hypothetical protein
MSCTRIQTDATEPIYVYAVKGNGNPLTGKTDLYVNVRRDSDGFFYDWNDNTFKSSGWTTLNKLLTEISATNAPGVYYVSGGFDTSAIVSKATDDSYQVIPLQTPGTDARLPGPIEIKEGDFVDDIDAAISSRAAPGAAMDLVTDAVDAAALATTGVNEIRDSILSDSTPFDGADVAAILADTTALDSRLPADPADESNQLAQHTATQNAITALNDLAIADIQTALTNQGYTAARAPNLDNLDTTISSRSSHSAADAADSVWDEALSGHTGAGTTGEAQNRLDAEVSTRSAPGDAMDLITDAVDNTTLATSAVNEVRDAILTDSTSFNGADIAAILADTNAMDTRLPSDPADQSLLVAEHTQTQADIAALNNLSATDVENAVWDATLSSHQTAGSTGEALENADATADPSAIADAVWDEALSGHTTVGSAGEAQNRLDDDISSRATQADIISDATPFAGANIAAILADTNAIDTRLPSDPADESNQLAQHTQTQADIAALNNLDISDVQTALTNQGYTAARAPSLDNLDAAVTTRAVPGDAMDLVTDALDSDSLATTGANEIRDAILADSTPFNGADIAAILADTTALDSRIPTDPADQSLLIAQHTQTQSDIAALNNLDATDVENAVWDAATASHQTAGTTGKALTDASATADPAAIADAVWDETLSTHIIAGSAGEAQNRLDAAITTRAQSGEAMDLIAGALDANSLDVTAVAEIADGIWDEALSGHIVAGSAGLAQQNLDAAITTRSAPGDAMDLITNALDAAAIDSTGGQEIADFIWDELLAGHTTAGSAGEAQNRLDATIASRAAPGDAMGLTPTAQTQVTDSIWDEPISGHLGAGSTGKALDDAKATADPNTVASAVWDKAAAAHTGAGSMGQLQNRLDAVVSSRAAPGDPMDLQANALSATSLATSAAQKIRDEILSDSTSFAGANIDATISSRSAPGAAMDLVTDALDANALATSAVNELVDQVWQEQLSDHSGVVGSTAEGLNTAGGGATPAAIADAVWDELLSGHTGVGSAGEAIGRVDVSVSSRSAPGDAMDLISNALDSASMAVSAAQKVRDEILTDSTPFAGANIDAAITTRTAPGDTVGLVANAITAITVDPTAAQEIADFVWDEPLTGHVASGTAGEAQAKCDVAISSRTAPGDAMGVSPGAITSIVDGVWDEQTSGHTTAGSTGKALTDAGATADPAAIADAVWDEAQADHIAPGSMGENQQKSGEQSDKIDQTPVNPATATPGSLVDILCNKDATREYNQATDSLQAIRDKIGGL